MNDFLERFRRDSCFLKCPSLNHHPILGRDLDYFQSWGSSFRLKTYLSKCYFLSLERSTYFRIIDHEFFWHLSLLLPRLLREGAVRARVFSNHPLFGQNHLALMIIQVQLRKERDLLMVQLWLVGSKPFFVLGSVKGYQRHLGKGAQLIILK